jgi:hypothetical protein
VEGSCEHANELSGSIKAGIILVWLSEYQSLNDDSAAWSSLHTFLVHLHLYVLRRISMGFFPPELFRLLLLCL